MGRFDALSDLDFEELVADLLRADTGLPFRAGTRGRDRGVDVLAHDAHKRRHEAQCKHYRDSTYAQLKAAVRKEAAGLRRRKPRLASYRLVTSRRLNHEQRAELAQLLAPWIGSEENVLGEGDLRRLLRAHEAVERRHVKLWLSGAGQLRRMLHAGAYERSRALLEDTQASLPRYVQTEAFLQAREILGREGVCVVAGPPGVGKTTLAKLLLLDALEVGYQPYEIALGGLADAWDLLDDNERQLFFFDDFLGQTALDERRPSETDLLRFMRRVARSKHGRFVLATREYILRQARQLSEVLDRETSDVHRFLLTVEHYSREERARIFYNHIWCSEQVDRVARGALLRGRGYLKVIYHPNYSPRLIEWITGLSAHRLTEEDRHRYLRFCLRGLSSPSQLWRHAFEQGLDDASRALLLALVGLPTRVALDVVEQAFVVACRVRDLNIRGRRFEKTLAILDDSFLVSRHQNDVVVLSFINPSLLDFLRSYLHDSPADAELAVRGACMFEQVVALWSLMSAGRKAPRELISAFAAAFQRTFDSTPLEGERSMSISEMAAREELDSPHARLNALLGRIGSSRALREAVRPWLPAAARRWLTSLRSSRQLSGENIALAGRLIAADALTRDRAGLKFKRLASRTKDRHRRWELLAEVHRLVPEVFDEDEWSVERQEFATWADDVLDDAAGYMEDFDDLQNFSDLAHLMGVELAEARFAQAWGDVETAVAERDAERHADWEPDYDAEDFRELRGGGDDDADIAAMFERLAE